MKHLYQVNTRSSHALLELLIYNSWTASCMWTLKSWENKMPACILMLKASTSQQLENVEFCCHPFGFWPSGGCDQFNYWLALSVTFNNYSLWNKPLKLIAWRFFLDIVYLKFIKIKHTDLDDFTVLGFITYTQIIKNIK